MCVSNSLVIVFTVTVLQVLGRCASQNDDLIVQLPDGKIRGHFLESLNGKQYYAFQDIPYAAPPTDELRFQEPQNPQPWDGIINTTSNEKQCPQKSYRKNLQNERYTAFSGNEDCLYINVFSPQKPGSTDLLPVLFWIHGGGFTTGSGAVNASRFMDHDILVVSFNYRLGPLGFLTTEDGVIQSNIGLKDQDFAIKWVNTNIKLFGGDPDKVTIMGESAGAHSVGYQLVSNGPGLFRGVIQDSGTSIGQMAYAAHPRQNAFTLGRIIDPNFTSEDSKDLLELLKKTSAEDMIEGASKLVPADPNTAGYCFRFNFVPALESQAVPNPFITNPMHQSFIDGTFHRVPMMLGFNSEEALAFLSVSNDYLAGQYDEDPSSMVEQVWNVPAENRSTFGSELRKIYTNSSFAEDKAAFVKYSSDAGYITGVIRQAQVASKYVPAYLYQFSYEGPLGLYVGPRRYDVPGAEGVSHGEELIYLWYYAPATNSSDQLTSQRAVTLWSNFVKYQNPTPEADELLNNIIWPTVQADSDVQYLDINAELEVKSNPRVYNNVSSLLLKYLKPPHVVF